MKLIFINDFLLQVHPLTMAEHKLFSMVEQMIACSICVDVLDDPRHLPCLHIYCYKCLVQYLSSNYNRDVIECPECREWFLLPNGKVEDLPVTFLHNKLKDVKPPILIDKKRKVKDITVRYCNKNCNLQSQSLILIQKVALSILLRRLSLSFFLIALPIIYNDFSHYNAEIFL